MTDVDRIIELTETGSAFCLATVVASGNPAVPPGRKVIVPGNGTLEGSLGDGRLDEALRVLALKALADNKKGTMEVRGVQVFLDILATDLRLVVCGAGHIALPVSRFAREAGFKVTVIDDRPDFAHPLRFPGCEVIAEDFVKTLRNMDFTPSTYAVIITRGHEHDAECLAEILPRETAYVGLIGSRRRVRFVLDMLAERGVSPERLREVFTPIGIPIGAETPEEIALSIVSELVCVRRKGYGQARALRAVAEVDHD